MRQLEEYILAHHLEVPAAVAPHDTTLKQLTTLFASDLGLEPLPTNNVTQAAAVGPSPRAFLERPSITQEPSPSDATQPVPPTDLDISPGNVESADAVNETAHGLVNPFDLDAQLPPTMTVDADWVWNMSMISQFDNEMLSNVLDDAFTTHNIVSSPQVLPLANRTVDLPTPNAMTEDDHQEDDDDRMAVTDQFAARLGTLVISRNSQSRFYGSTSNFSLVHIEHLTSSVRSTCPTEQQVQERLNVAGFDQTIDRELVNHLLCLYFTWHDPCLHVVDQELFECARGKYEAGEADTPLFSPLLLNAM